MADKIKIVLALALLGAGIAGFYALSEQALVVRVLCVLGGVGAAVAVAMTSAPGRRFAGFSRESINEARKVVWPTRKETIQSTGMVFAFVVVIAIFLWLTDKGLEWVLYDLVLGWK
ncbi:MAG TPA: preprotein translocase subunit SecE [Azoarcus sp.]|nr:preprotein translocase subunit SecE [Azoarcus sp.]